MTAGSCALSARPAQWREDVIEVVDAYQAGGKPLAQRAIRAIIEARPLVL